MTKKLPKLSDYAEDVQKCMRCGFCRNLCPTFNSINWEAGSPRGRMQLAKAFLDGDIEFTDYMKERIYECALCGYCTWRCPAGVKTIDVVKAARAHMLENKASPQNVQALLGNLSKEHNLYGLSHTMRTDWLGYPWIGLKDKVELSRKGAQVLYFVGCICSYSGKKNMTGKATAQILSKTGADWTLLGNDEWCCGDPSMLSGDFGFALESARHNVGMAQDLGVKKVVTSCAGCYRMWKQEYPALLDENPGIEVQHISQYITEALQSGKLKLSKELKTTLTYHDPCELGRLGEVFDEPRQILKAVPGVEFKEMAKNRYLSRCCGGGGDLKVAYPDMSMEVGTRRLKEAQDTGAKGIVSCCPACELQLSDVAQKNGVPMQVFNIAEIVARAMAP
ncbi:(Fe-S)-binding protein [Candidatus Bathyarchaeota archaeon]|nr:(Fe-S)-binding protein [Candidatus Bathyarchaeota archaeon]